MVSGSLAVSPSSLHGHFSLNAMTLFGPISAVILGLILNSTFFKWAFFVYGIGLEAD